MAHDNHYVGLTLTTAVSGCAGATQPTCGACSLSGPVANGGGATYNNGRCADATWLTCDDYGLTGQCTGQGAAGPCRIFFGPPLPYSAGGVSVCVTNEITGSLSAGSTVVEDGSATMTLPYLARIYTGPNQDRPCPECVGGFCDAGPRIGMPCTTNGVSPLFGNVSFDCPPSPGNSVGDLVPSGLTLSTSDQTMTLSAASPNCKATGFTGLKCFCETCNNLNASPCDANADCADPPGPIGPICGGRRCLGGGNSGAACTLASECPGGACGVPGEFTRTNACDDATCTPNTPPDNDSVNEGTCAAGPFESYCAISSYRGCLVDGDCPGLCSGGTRDGRVCSFAGDCPGGTCNFIDTCSDFRLRDCFTDNGAIGGSITAGGVANPPVNGTASATLGSVFCIPANIASAVNAVGGFPGPGRVTLPGTFTYADETVSGVVGGGGTVTTDTESDGATPSDPLETAVTSPTGGEIVVTEQADSGTPPPGFTLLGKQVNITAPPATPASPLTLVFRIDASRLLPGQNENSIDVFKDGSASSIPACSGAGATPDPCVSSRTLLGDGDVEIVILTSSASLWGFFTTNLCGAAPDPSCRQPAAGKSLLHLKDKSPDGKDQLKWKWGKGEITTKAEFGDPTGTESYQLCLYANGQPIFGTLAPAGGVCADGKDCWADKPTGYKYKDKDATPHGLVQILLKEGLEPEKAKIIVKGKGLNLAMPNLPGLSAPLTVQLKKSGGGPCWGTAYPGPFLKQELEQLKAKN